MIYRDTISRYIIISIIKLMFSSKIYLFIKVVNLVLMCCCRACNPSVYITYVYKVRIKYWIYFGVRLYNIHLEALKTVHMHKGIYLGNRFIDFSKFWKKCSQDICYHIPIHFNIKHFITYTHKIIVKQSLKFQKKKNGPIRHGNPP